MTMLYEGYGEAIEIGQVRMDVEGKLALVIGIFNEAILLEIKPLITQHIPFESMRDFTETTWSLGEL